MLLESCRHFSKQSGAVRRAERGGAERCSAMRCDAVSRQERFLEQRDMSLSPPSSNCRRCQPSQPTDPYQPAFALGSPVGVGCWKLDGRRRGYSTVPQKGRQGGANVATVAAEWRWTRGGARKRAGEKRIEEDMWTFNTRNLISSSFPARSSVSRPRESLTNT